MMFSYFREWKRKLGCVTLVVACVLMTAWVRSRVAGDQFAYRTNENTQHVFLSGQSGFTWMTMYEGSSSHIVYRNGHTALTGPSYQPLRSAIWSKTFCGFQVGELPRERDTTTRVFVAPYWSMVIPLTALSAWFLLSKRRQPTEPEPSQDLGA